MVSMKDISQRCQVSVATVSKALNNRGDISRETRERICRVAKELGYLPNSSARALKTNRSYNLGVLFVDEADSGLTHSYFSHVLDSFRRGAEEEGYDITFISRHAGKNIFSYYEHSKYRGVDGVLVACVDFSTEELKELVNGDIPVITIDFVFDNRTCILSDNVYGMEELVTYIIRQGHEKIAYIHGADSSVTQSRLNSFFQTMKRFGIPVRKEYMQEGVYHAPDVSAKLTEKLLSLQDRPTCIIYPDDFSCIGGINVIERQGLSIPADISVVGYDGQRIAQVMEPKITTYKQNTQELGRIAAKKLIELIEKPESALIERIVVKGELVQGKSVLQCK
ncbi:MAG: LacI family DNA-binding transcriptional regulator [Lachnospiraceae bacterium]|nr:LacI family DNA-binding transcriptional regulator [Lachnospiraceae bacterium]